MLQESEFMRRGVDLLTEEDFEYEGHRKVVEWIFERGAGIEVVDGEHDVLGGCEDPDIRKLVAGMLMEDLPGQAVERVFSDCVGVMRRRRKQKRIEELRGIINEKERKGERVPPDVLQEQMRLLVELKARRDVTARE